MKVLDFLIEQYSRLPLDNQTGKSFYSFLNEELKSYQKALKEIDEKDLQVLLNDNQNFFQKPYTLRRCCNLLNKICKDLLKVLAFCYKGDTFSAHQHLFRVLHNTSPYSDYLNEEYINYIGFSTSEKKVYYRMRDAKNEEEVVDNCWHVPYEFRRFAQSGRYSLIGFPCLYLADSKETADAEINKLQNGQVRWVSEFSIKKELYLYNLCIPSMENLRKMNSYDLLVRLITYPYIVACSSKSHPGAFNDEYYIPQMFLSLCVLNPDMDKSYKGITYSSTKNEGGFKMVLPALYKGKEPIEEFSPILQEYFDAQPPTIYKKNDKPQ